MATAGQGLFSLYIYVENFKNLLVRKKLYWFQYKLAEMLLWWPSAKIVQAMKIQQRT